MRGLLVAVATLLFPGFAPGLAGRAGAMAAWIAAATLLALGSALSVWFIPLYIVVRIAAAIDGLRVMRAFARSGERLHGLEGLIAIGTTIAIQIGLQFAVEAYKIPASSMMPTIEIGDHIMTEKLSLHWRDSARGELIVFRQPCSDRDFVKRVIAVGGDTVEIRCNVVYVGGRALPSQLVNGDSCSYDDFDEPNEKWYPRQCSEYTETADDRTYHVYHDPDRPLRDDHPRGGSRPDAKDFPGLDAAAVPPSCATSESFAPPGAAPDANQARGSIVETKPGVGPCELQRHYVVPPGHVFVLGDNRANSNDSRYWGAVPIENIKGRVTGIWWSGGKSGMNLRRFGRVD
jgi:signal peptidase I